jgi:hypothetical protein
MDEDIKLRPEWEKYTEKFSWRSASQKAVNLSDIVESNASASAKLMCDETPMKARALAAGCPFAYLM